MGNRNVAQRIQQCVEQASDETDDLAVDLSHLDLRGDSIPSELLDESVRNQITSLNLSRNNLSRSAVDTLWLSIANLPRLEGLLFQSNRLIALPASLPVFVSLTSLDLTSNLLTMLPDDMMSSLPNLIVLLLDYNRLEELPSKITELKSLKRLGVSNNRLSGLPARLSLIPSLEEIRAEGNPFAPGLTKAIKKKEVLGYLRAQCGWQQDSPMDSVFGKSIYETYYDSTSIVDITVEVQDTVVTLRAVSSGEAVVHSNGVEKERKEKEGKNEQEKEANGDERKARRQRKRKRKFQESEFRGDGDGESVVLRWRLYSECTWEAGERVQKLEILSRCDSARVVPSPSINLVLGEGHAVGVLKKMTIRTQERRKENERESERENGREWLSVVELFEDRRRVEVKTNQNQKKKKKKKGGDGSQSIYYYCKHYLSSNEGEEGRGELRGVGEGLRIYYCRQLMHRKEGTTEASLSIGLPCLSASFPLLLKKVDNNERDLKIIEAVERETFGPNEAWNMKTWRKELQTRRALYYKLLLNPAFFCGMRRNLEKDEVEKEDNEEKNETRKKRNEKGKEKSWLDRLLDLDVGYGEAMGLCGLAYRKDIGRAHVTNMAVRPAFQGMKLGVLMLLELVTVSSSLHIPHIFLEVRKSNKVAQGCYKKAGFVEERVLKKYYTNEDGLFMRLKWLDDEAVISTHLSLHREIQSLCSTQADKQQ